MSHAQVANWTLADSERAAEEYCASSIMDAVARPRR